MHNRMNELNFDLKAQISLNLYFSGSLPTIPGQWHAFTLFLVLTGFITTLFNYVLRNAFMERLKEPFVFKSRYLEGFYYSLKKIFCSLWSLVVPVLYEVQWPVWRFVWPFAPQRTGTIQESNHGEPLCDPIRIPIKRCLWDALGSFECNRLYRVWYHLMYAFGNIANIWVDNPLREYRSNVSINKCVSYAWLRSRRFSTRNIRTMQFHI